MVQHEALDSHFGQRLFEFLVEGGIHILEIHLVSAFLGRAAVVVGSATRLGFSEPHPTRSQSQGSGPTL